MTNRRKREFLKSQFLETQHLGEMVKDHPLMSLAYRQREEELQGELNDLPLGEKEARTILFFSGEPVKGSLGIDANFAGRVLEPFQNMVMADYADRWHGVVGSRGRRPGESESRLLLTGLPRGSFGLELSKAENNELYEENQLADTLAHVTRLVESAAKSDEDFASRIDDTAPRVIQNLKQFLETVSKGNAGVSVESGDLRCSVKPEEAKEAYDRVAATVTKDEDLELKGTFKGVLLDSWKFDFTDENSHKISGRLDDDLTPEKVEALAKEFFNQPCLASLVKSTVLFKNGRERTTYRLRDLQSLK